MYYNGLQLSQFEVNTNLFWQLFFYPQLASTFVAMARIALLMMCFAILFQSVQRTWIVASWKINQSYIASTLCENRMEKKSCCAGSCYLNKQLKENEAKEESTPLNEKQRVEYVSDLFSFSIDVKPSPCFSINSTFPLLLMDGQPKGVATDIFHPPAFIVG